MKETIEIGVDYAKEACRYMMYDMYKKEIGFTLVSSPNRGRQQVLEVSTCRDYLHERMRDHIDLCKSSADEGIPDLDFKRLRMLLIIGPDSPIEYKANLFSAKRVLNIYEKMAGWKNSSKITSVGYRKGHMSLLLTGPGEWMGHPMLMSMLTLVLRVGMRFGPLPSKKEDLKKKWKDIVITGNDCDNDSDYLSLASKYFPILMKYYKKLFTTVGKEAYTGVGHYDGGIVAMAKNLGFDKELSAEIHKIYKDGA